VCSRISDPALAPMLRRLYYDESETWAEIYATHHIPSALEEQIPLGQATANSLRAYLSIASNEHRAVALESSSAYREKLRHAIHGVLYEARKSRACSVDLSRAIDIYDLVIQEKEV